MKGQEENQALTIGMFRSIFEPAMARIDKRFEAIDRRFEAMDARFDSLEAKMMEGFTMLDKKIDFVDQRSRERDEELMRRILRNGSK